MAAPAKKLEESGFSLTIERAILLKSLGKLQTIVEKRNALPILANVKLETQEDGLALTTTDMDLEAREIVPAQVTAGGAATVPAHTFYDIIRKLPEGAQVAIDLDPTSGQVLIESGNAKFNLSYLPAEDFPVMAEGDMSHQLKLSAKDLVLLIEKTRFAMSSEETRYYLNGVYLHAAPGEGGDEVLKAVATDGHRLARIEMALPAGAEGMPGIIIPRKAVGELKKILEEEESDIEIALSETKIRFAIGNTVLLSKLIDGTFPDYERVIPSGNDKLMEVDTKLLAAAVDRVSTISTEKTRGIKFALDKGKLTLSATSPESGNASEEVDVSFSSDPVEIGFNSRYVLDMMAQLEGESAKFHFADSTAPVLVHDPSNVGALYVIMPMRV